MANNEIIALAESFRRMGKGADAFLRACFNVTRDLPRHATLGSGAGPVSVTMTPSAGGPIPIPYPAGTPSLSEQELKEVLKKLQAALLSGVYGTVLPAMRAVVEALRTVFSASAEQVVRLVAQAIPYVGPALSVCICIVLVVVVLVFSIVTMGAFSVQAVAALVAAGLIVEDVAFEVLTLFSWVSSGAVTAINFAAAFFNLVSDAAIRSALLLGFAFLAYTGLAPTRVSALVRHAARCMRRRSDDLAKTMLQIWAQAPQRPGLAQMLGAMRTELNLSVEFLAGLLGRQGIALATIADTVIALFGRDMGQLARSLKEAQASIGDNAGLLKQKLNAGASAIASAFKEQGYNADHVAGALRSAQFPASEAASALKDVFSLDLVTTARKLKSAGFSDVAGAVASAFGKAREVVEQMLRAAGV